MWIILNYCFPCPRPPISRFVSSPDFKVLPSFIFSWILYRAAQNLLQQNLQHQIHRIGIHRNPYTNHHPTVQEFPRFYLDQNKGIDTGEALRTVAFMNLTFQVSYVAERQGSLVSRFVELMWPDGTIWCVYIYMYRYVNIYIYIFIYILYISMWRLYILDYFGWLLLDTLVLIFEVPKSWINYSQLGTVFTSHNKRQTSPIVANLGSNVKSWRQAWHVWGQALRSPWQTRWFQRLAFFWHLVVGHGSLVDAESVMIRLDPSVIFEEKRELPRARIWSLSHKKKIKKSVWWESFRYLSCWECWIIQDFFPAI